MASNQPITLQIQTGDKAVTTDKFQIREWQKSDGTQRSVIAIGVVLLIAVLMIPIPIVHFAAIPVVLFGTPLAGIITFKLYSKGADLHGHLVCPECGASRTITRSVSYWPVSVQCLGCKQHLTISRSNSQSAATD